MFNKKDVAIVVPFSNRVDLSSDEKLSLKHLYYYLNKYDKYQIVQKGFPIVYPGFKVKFFDSKFFGSVEAHNKLMLSKNFYLSFAGYKYILIYHLDTLVFSDQLYYWCQAGYDFIGPPWIKHPHSIHVGNPLYEGKVGNGGFSLRNVDSFLKVFDSKNMAIDPKDYWHPFKSKSRWVKFINLHKKYLKEFRYFNSVIFELAKYRYNEDTFWANRSKHYYSNFKIPSVKTALRFGFECLPDYCYKLNNNMLPFGCHAWAKNNRKFWEPYLL